ncbi:formate dehydrogenase subunit gamma [Litorivita sp. NS0012-18]|uniref:formate dehydrogenase subunit gamma n=1 Tax=Litorivita sp. NS0012-18 TaxID=3127655 RepID=UPI003106B638
MTTAASAAARQPSSQDITEACTAALAAHEGAEGPLLPVLHEVQSRLGYLPQAAYPILAQALNITAAEVHGVASFYHDFRDLPAGRHVLKICRAEACQAVGGRDLEAAAKALFGLEWHETTPDGALTLEPVYCLGLCACGPAALLDGAPMGRVTLETLERIKSEVQS